MSLIQSQVSLQERGTERFDTCRKGGNVTTEAESAVIDVNEVRECQQPPSEAGRARNRFSPRTSRERSAHTLILAQ